jgi:hypothetical protein
MGASCRNRDVALTVIFSTAFDAPKLPDVQRIQAVRRAMQQGRETAIKSQQAPTGVTKTTSFARI